MPRSFLSRHFTLCFGLVAAAAVLLVYREVWNYYLYNDDFRWMRQARFDMQPGNLLTFQVIGFFRPFMNLAFYATERLMPNDLHAYYATNLALHLGNGVLVFHLLARLFGDRWLAAGTSLFFLISCTHWAAVGWISGRTTLISTAFLLLSMLVLVGRARGRGRRWGAVGLYALALASKEDAVVGVLLLALVFSTRKRDDDTLPDRRTLVYFAAATLVYVGVRTAVIGHVTQENWGPGPHALRNLAGGFLYQVYPWAAMSLLGKFEAFDVSSRALWPEILAIPALLVLVAAARRLGRSRQVLFALAWLFVGLLPVSMFRFRFFSTDWLTHDRYYYLSSMGACLGVAALLSGLWHARRARATVVVAAAVIAIGEPGAVDNRAGRFLRMTDAYRNLVHAVSERMDAYDGLSTCALQDWPLQPAFTEDVFALVRPDWRVVPVAGAEETEALRPCLHVRIVVDGGRMRTEAAEIR